MFVLGCLLIIIAPLVGVIPGPGGVFVFAAGFALVLKIQRMGEAPICALQARHPNKGRWADWGLRRLSARRREERLKREQAEQADAGNASVSD